METSSLQRELKKGKSRNCGVPRKNGRKWAIKHKDEIMKKTN
jgi:hypothetical protein